MKFSDGKGGSRRISSQRVPLTVWADATDGTNEAKPKTMIAISFMEQPIYFVLFKQNEQHQHKLIPMDGNFEKASICHEMNRCKEPT